MPGELERLKMGTRGAEGSGAATLQRGASACINVEQNQGDGLDGVMG